MGASCASLAACHGDRRYIRARTGSERHLPFDSNEQTPPLQEINIRRKYTFDASGNAGALEVGATGCVVKAMERNRSQSEVAIKIITKSSHHSKKHFLNEVDILKRVQHHNIVRLFDIGEDRDNYYIALTLGRGGDLVGCIFDDQFEITESRAAEWTCCMLETVRYLHSKDIVHRDLKPENVVFKSDRGGHDLLFIDFGLSKRVNNVSVYNDLCANKWYTAPEVAAHYLCGEDERSTHQLPAYLTQIAYGRRCPIQLTGSVWKSADIWAIGVMAYSMMARKLPFTAKTNRGIFEQIVFGDLPMELDSNHSNQSNPTPNPLDEDAGNPGHSTQCSTSSSSGFSELFRDFMARILEKDPFRRITVDDALKHPWVRGLTASEVEMNSEIVSMLTFPHFEYLNKFKSLVIHKMLAQWDSAVDSVRTLNGSSIPLQHGTVAGGHVLYPSMVSVASMSSMGSWPASLAMTPRGPLGPMGPRGTTSMIMKSARDSLKMKKVPSSSTGTEVSQIYDLPPELKRDGLCPLFEHLDKDGDGLLTQNDIERVLLDYGWNTYSIQSEAENIMQRLDWNGNGNGNGTVDLKAFRIMRCRMLLFEDSFVRRVFEIEEEHDTMEEEEYFDDLDIERRFGRGMHSVDEIRWMMDEWSESRDGVISWKRICEAMKEMPSKYVVEGFLRECYHDKPKEVDLNALMTIQDGKEKERRISMSSLLLKTIQDDQKRKRDKNQIPLRIINQVLDVLYHFEVLEDEEERKENDHEDEDEDEDGDEDGDGDTRTSQRWD